MTEITQNPLFLMKMIVDRAEALFTQQGKEPQLTAPQCRLLLCLEAQEGGKATQRDLQRLLELSHTTVTGLLQRLEAKGYVRTAFDDKRDGRVKSVYLTPEFRERHQATRETMRIFEQQIFSSLTEKEREDLQHLLGKIHRGIL